MSPPVQDWACLLLCAGYQSVGGLGLSGSAEPGLVLCPYKEEFVERWMSCSPSVPQHEPDLLFPHLKTKASVTGSVRRNESVSRRLIGLQEF